MATWWFSKLRADVYRVLLHAYSIYWSIRYAFIIKYPNLCEKSLYLDSKKKNLEEILELYGLDSHLFYSKRSSNIQCSITKSVASKISTLSTVDVVHMHVYPSVLKIDTSLLNYFQSPQTFVKSRKAAIPIEDTTKFIELPYSLSIEWAPYSISSGSSM